MHRSLFAATAVLLLPLATLAGTSAASTPGSGALTLPSSGSAKVTWTGTAGPGVDSGGCGTSTTVTDDHHTLKLAVPGGLYDHHATAVTVHVLGLTAGTDLDLQVLDPAGTEVGSSTGPAGDESVTLKNPAAGSYDVVVCPGTVLKGDYKATATAVTTTVKAAAAATTSAPVGRSTMTFTPATVVDPILFGGEPGFTFDNTAKGGSRSFVDWPVTSRTQIGVLFRSEDGGLSYTKRYAPVSDAAAGGPACATRQVAYCPSGGGGDTDIDINSGTGSIAMGEQESLANQAVGVSLDHGTTFPADHVDPALDKTSTGVDRQWQASWKGTKTRFMAYHVPVVGEFVNRTDSDGAAGSWSIPPVPQIKGVTQSGSFVADNSGGIHNHALYLGFLGSSLVPGGLDGFIVAASTDGAKTFVQHKIPGAKSPRSFTVLSVDSVGNLYAAWVDSGTQATYLSTSLANDPANRVNPATKWSPAVQVSRDPLNVTIFSNTVAGSPGRVAIGYYGTTAHSPTPDAVKPGQGGWYPYVAYSANALCQWDAHPCEAPTFSQDRIAHRPNHDTNICTSGTTCAANPSSNRNLLDYFAIDVDTNGHLGFVWSDTNNATLEPYVKVARQASGPSLYAGRPNAFQPARHNGQSDALGDAKYPIAGAKILTAKNQRALDLAGTSIARTSNGNVEVHMKVPSLPSLSGSVLPATIDDSTVPIQQARYVTRWDYEGQAYYVEATLNGTEGGYSYGSGTVSTGEGVFNGNPTATLGNTYQPLTAATGRIAGGEIVIDVPAASVGSPTAGAQVYSVGSYSVLGPKDAVGVLQALPITVDSTPTFDTALPVIAPKVRSASAGGSVVGVPAPQANGASAPALGSAAVPAAKPAKAARRQSTADSSTFVKVAAVGGSSLVMLLFWALLYLRYKRRAHH
ncbi:MAG: hypothetical protein JWP11_568 [Frankiales bacterium]|nr:hypothetical protein [Frankiales bacterium]